MNSIKLRVQEAPSKDVGRAVARIDPGALEVIEAEVGDLIDISGEDSAKAVAKVMPLKKSRRGEGVIQMDGILRQNAAASVDTIVAVEKTEARTAREVELTPLTISADPQSRDDSYVKRLLLDLPMRKGNIIRANLFGSGYQNFRVLSTEPSGNVMVSENTEISLHGMEEGGEDHSKKAVSYEDIGGLDQQLKRVREMIELPLKFPQLFEQLGIDPPKGVLLHGAPGTGKTLIARAVSNESESQFFLLNGPEIMNKYYGESEARLRRMFKKAQKAAPSIVFIDEIDAICPKREEVRGDVEKRVVSQLLALMDGLKQREQVIVIGATNIPDVLDPALRRGGRFDREMAIPIPTKKDREEILQIHTRGMPLAEEIDLTEIAEITHGFVGADIEALAREAAMGALRRGLPDLDPNSGTIPYEKILNLKVRAEDFQNAFQEVEPSATREVFVETPEVSWNDVGGLQEEINKLRQIVEWPIQHPETFEYMKLSPPSGILLYGPPGTGKTLLAKALASESEINFISVRGPELLTMYVGESEKKVREIFKKARQAAPCIVFFDEIEALASERGGGLESKATERVTSQMLNELDGLQSLEGVVVIGATNRKDLIDEALLRAGRLEVHLRIDNPDLVARKEIFQVHTRDLPLEEIDYEELALDTKGFNGADIEYICREAALSKIEDYLENEDDRDLKEIRIGQGDLVQQIEHLKQSVENPDEE
ncbi:MAG: CDC48 family AAA ATPase [Candidatus Acetothermia bacterium]